MSEANCNIDWEDDVEDMGALESLKRAVAGALFGLSHMNADGNRGDYSVNSFAVWPIN